MRVEETAETLKMSDGFNLFCRHWKTEGKSERALVCIHGFGGHSGFFKPFGEILACGGINVYALDLRGFGNSKEKDLPMGDTSDFGIEQTSHPQFATGFVDKARAQH